MHIAKGGRVVNGMLFPGIAPSTYEDVEEFLNHSEYAKNRFTEASEVIGYPLIEAFKESGELDYEIKECAFLANTIALMDHYNEVYNLKPDVIISPSFGGLAAAIKSGSLTYSEAVGLTYDAAKIAGDYYQSLGDLYQTIFIYNLSATDAHSIVEEFKDKNMYLELVGYLGKVMCFCGPSNSINDLKEKIHQKPKVMATHTMQQPIHSKLLTELKEKLRDEVFNQVSFKPLNYSILSDVNGGLIQDSTELKALLLDGYDHAVRWDLVTNTMKEMNFQMIYVIGPQNIFSQLLKKEWKTIDFSPNSVLKKMKGSL